MTISIQVMMLATSFSRTGGWKTKVNFVFSISKVLVRVCGAIQFYDGRVAGLTVRHWI